MSPSNLRPGSIARAIHVYTDFDSTVTLRDTGDMILAHEMGHQELRRIDRLPETDPENVTLRKAEDMKWKHVRLSVKEVVDILVGPGPTNATSIQGEIDGTCEEKLETTATTAASPSSPARRVPFDNDAAENSYRIKLDPGFESLHRFCKEHSIPLTIISINIQPLIEEILIRYLGSDHGIEVRANGLTFDHNGSWKIQWRDSSPFGVEKGRAIREARANDLQDPSDCIVWCGDGSSDFPAALESDIVFARQGTSLEKLCKANQAPAKKSASKKVAAAPYPVAKKGAAKAPVNPLIEKTPKNFGIGQDVQPIKDLSRYVKWPEYVRLQRQRKILNQRLKVPPALNQFTQVLDKNTATQLFKLVNKYRPETRIEKKERLTAAAAAQVEKGEKKTDNKKPFVVKYGLNHITALIEAKKASLVVIADDVDPIEIVVWLPA
ncbi:60S ribosomal protein L8B, partial [Podila humilis]